MKKTAFSIAGVVIAAVILLGFSQQQRIRIERRQNEVRSEAGMLRDQMRTAYLKRGILLRQWAAGTPYAKEPDLNSLVDLVGGLELKTQMEFDRFDAAQDILNRKIAKLLTDKKTAKKKPAEWDASEMTIASARKAYAKRALSANRMEHLPESLPLFKAEESLAPDPN